MRNCGRESYPLQNPTTRDPSTPATGHKDNVLGPLLRWFVAADHAGRQWLDLADRVEIAYAYSPTAARREAFTAQFPVPTCDRLETILDDPSIDAVIVLTPPNTHLDIVGRCAAAGVQ